MNTKDNHRHRADASTENQVVCFGEILWDMLPEGRQLGGAPLNVCYHLRQQGINSTIITQTGDDQPGRDIRKLLQQKGIDQQYCLLSAHYPTSTVDVLVDADQHISYTIREQVAWDYIIVNADLERCVAESSMLVFGSLIARNPVSRNTLLKLIQKSAFRVFDINLRKPHYDREIIFELLQKTNLLKLNGEELSIITGWLPDRNLSENDPIQQLFETFPSVKEIIVTQGAAGAVYYSHHHTQKVQGVKVRVKDTVGSGDAFLAGFLTARIRGSALSEALEHAVLLSAFVAAHAGACPEYTEADLKEFRKGVTGFPE